MDEHFRAFTFVSRITSVEPGVRIRGTYAIPPNVGSFPHSLVAEAVGQLAAWSAMAAVDFKFRPVAGLAGKIELLSPVRPGQTLELAAELETADTEAVAYGGTAHADGVPVIKLEHCVGPMMPMEDFDDPAAMREQFGLFCRETAAPGGFRGTPPVTIESGDSETGKSKSATLHVPASAPFFADHFPRRPVFPGTLLMNFNLQLAAQLAV
jgi:3-hydroxymyristoyl/3-hydroxydecanoyl-(acyl carrier protein) dehydratase